MPGEQEEVVHSYDRFFARMWPVIPIYRIFELARAILIRFV